MKFSKVLVCFILLSVLSSCSGKIKETIGQTDQYAENDIREAMKVVENQYKEYVPGIFGCKLKSISFDGKESQQILESFKGKIDTEKTSDRMAFTSTIRTGMGAGSLSDFSTYSFYWVVENRADWKVVYGGFLN